MLVSFIRSTVHVDPQIGIDRLYGSSVHPRSDGVRVEKS